VERAREEDLDLYSFADMKTAGLNHTDYMASCRLVHQRFWAVCGRSREH